MSKWLAFMIQQCSIWLDCNSPLFTRWCLTSHKFNQQKRVIEICDIKQSIYILGYGS